MTLSKQLLAKKARPGVIKDLVEVVQQEVASKKGVSGAALKAGYAAASRVVPNLTERALRKLFPDLARRARPVLGGLRVVGWHRLRSLPGGPRRGGLRVAARRDGREGRREWP